MKGLGGPKHALVARYTPYWLDTRLVGTIHALLARHTVWWFVHKAMAAR